MTAAQIALSLWLATPAQSADRQVVHSQAPAVAARLQPIGLLPDTTRLNLAISLPLRNQAALAGLLRQLYDPKSPNFHRYLTPAEFAEQFGPTKQDYQALMDFAGANHFNVTHTHPNRTLLDVSATVADIRRALRMNIKVYQHPTEGRTFYAPDADPSVDIGVAVLAIKGLDNVILPHANLRQTPVQPSGSPQPLAGSGTNGYYLGKDFRAAYVPGVSLDGTGQTAALVEFDGYYTNDITRYEQTPTPNLRAVPLTNVLVDGGSGTPGVNNREVALDIEMLIAMAPGLSRIMVYETRLFQSADDLFNQIATDDLAAQVSCSWSFTPDATADQVFQQYAAQGQSLFIASGDNGAYPAGFGNGLVDDPYATIVGGTQLSTSGAGGGGPWQAETVWNSSGGGSSSYYAIPDWQTGVAMSSNQGSTAFRNFPDVAICASNVFITYNDGSHGGVVGTSCGAPLWAGFTALLNQQAALSGNPSVGFLNPAIYALARGPGYAASFHDITVGNNTNSSSPSNYFAVPGYDLCTGWGAPNGSNLINALAPPDTLVLLPVPGFVSTGPAGGPFSVTMESFVLTNGSSAPLTWSLGLDCLWLSVSSNNGALNPSATGTVVVTLNSSASSLPCGDYMAHLTVTNLSNGLLHHRTFALNVFDPLMVSPATGLSFGDPPTAPFNSAPEICWLTNASLSSAGWSLVSKPLWLSIGPGSGILAPQSEVQITCSLNSAASNLPPGAYSGNILFSNLTFGASECLPAVLLNGQLAQNVGFETGDFTDWITNGDFSFASVATNSIAVHSGAYGVLLGTSGAPGYLSQTIPTVPGQLYSVSVWLNSPDGLTPNGFVLSWGGSTVCEFTNLPIMDWTNLQFVLPATNSSTVLQIEFQDDNGYLGLDDISVTAAPPAIGSVIPASGPAAGGTLVTIAGTGFQNRATVAFGSASATAVNFNSTSNITAVTPASAIGVVNVTITNADGQTAVLTNAFRFIGTPVITWANPPPTTYGNALGPAQLDATADVPGLFAYNPSAGTVLNSGSNLLSATFSPNDTVNYYSATDYVGLLVGPAPLTVSANDATRPYGLTNPVFTGVIAGLQNGDLITAGYSCLATSASPAGTFPIVPNLADPNHRLTNYQVTISNGFLTILPPVPPVFQTVTQSNTTLTLVWAATVGASYQVQYNTNLAATNWSDFGNSILATNAFTVVTDSIAGTQRYYRVVQVPQ